MAFLIREDMRSIGHGHLDASEALPALIRLLHDYERLCHSGIPDQRDTNIHHAWTTAQAICTLAEPATQDALNALRTQIMAIFISTEPEPKRNRKAAPSRMLPVHSIQNRIRSWVDIQLTPEVHCDPTLTGKKVPRTLFFQLRRALRTQVHAIRNAERIWGGVG